MIINFSHAQSLLKSFDFPNLFREELGWEPMHYAQDVTISEETYHLDALAHKRGFSAFRCHGKIPPYIIRRKIDSLVARSYHEHLIIYTDIAQTTQVWQWVKRQVGKPAASREHTFRREQSGQALLQKLEYLAVTLDDEDELTILDVADKVRGGFDVERVTKRFYDHFKDEHAAFLKFVEGIPEEGMQRWYVSVTLNRLMFVYFIQKKGFLDNDLSYLQNKMVEIQQKAKNRFYLDFLCPLFFMGFASKDHDPETVRLLGNVPYLNGGIFAKHQIEELYGEKLYIPDKAFERLFSFFDAYQWHLDERPLRRDDEINPDVLGYIFEKYINQKQMGAYYTKEDITEYISKNTVIPHLLDVAREECKIAFEGDRSIWYLLKVEPDRYIYKSVRHGISWNYLKGDINEGNDLDTQLSVPPQIAAGIRDVSKRIGWNTPAPEEFALPTETWREVLNRRHRYEEVRGRLANGDIRDVNDLITYNLDLRQFAQDAIENSEGPELLRAFWKAIRSVTVLDPTVGSGAFLFAALNILEPLYDACLERMQAFLDEMDVSSEPHNPEKFSDFRKVLADVDRHPNRHYFVLKSIIVNNLYGVDIMDEAVEICKLRLFLKLVAQVEHSEQVEPLPDIDFNIRAGNTLVGFATKEDVRRAVEITSGGQLKLVSTEDNAILKRIEEKAHEVERLFTLFRQEQTELGGEVRPEDKAELRRLLKVLDDELNIHLARQYGIHNYYSKEFSKWRENHKPFHWFVEFYGIMCQGGFDVIIGNPPYVEYSKVKRDYTLLGYETESCGNLYAYVIERNMHLSKVKRSGMIIPSAAFGVPNTENLRNVFKKCVGNLYISYYSGDAHPSILFEGVKLRLSIYITTPKQKGGSFFHLYTTPYLRWYAEERRFLFFRLFYNDVPSHLIQNTYPKIGSTLDISILEKVINKGKIAKNYILGSKTKYPFYYHNAPVFYIRAMNFIPFYESASSTGPSSNHFKTLYTLSDDLESLLISVLNSSTFYIWFTNYSANRDLTLFDIERFPLFFDPQHSYNHEKTVINNLMEDFQKNSAIREYNYNTGKVRYQEFYLRKSKDIIDEIDRALAHHYGFTEEELDFIINYDIKYRMGFELDEVG